MTNNIIPAIDLIDGQCVRLLQGKFDRKTIYSSDPIAIAKNWQKIGYNKLHIIDLDGARSGELKNLKIIKKIIQATNIPTQVGGGMRSVEKIKKLLTIGVKEVIISTSALDNDDFLKKIFKKFPNRIIVSLDAMGNQLVKNGWLKKTNKDLIKTAVKLEKLGVKKLIYTDVLKDGTQSSPNYAMVEKLVKNINIPIMVAGGISNKKQVKKLKKIGVESVIVGKALYEELLPTIIQRCKTNEILMLGYMNQEALSKTIKSKYVWFWSRSRNKLWLKGETSGNKLLVKEMAIDCDNDTILIKAKIIGQNICHTGNKSCFNRSLI